MTAKVREAPLLSIDRWLSLSLSLSSLRREPQSRLAHAKKAVAAGTGLVSDARTVESMSRGGDRRELLRGPTLREPASLLAAFSRAREREPKRQVRPGLGRRDRGVLADAGRRRGIFIQCFSHHVVSLLTNVTTYSHVFASMPIRMLEN